MSGSPDGSAGGGPTGIVVVDKPTGWTSHDVVARLRRLAGTRKVGHAGTLDPMATGVLVAGVGRATRLLGHLQLTDKAYTATIRLGESTTTDDAEGEPVAAVDVGDLGADGVSTAMAAFIGPILQVPSSVSAIKVDGVRSYARVRAGETVDLPARPVTVSAFELVECHPATRGTLDARVRVECSSGTYVRALARDLGTALGVGGHLTALRRTRVGPFTAQDARTLDQLADDGGFALLGLDEVAARCFETFTVSSQQESAVRHGRALPAIEGSGRGGPVAMMSPGGRFLALYEPRDGASRAVAVFV